MIEELRGEDAVKSDSPRFWTLAPFLRLRSRFNSFVSAAIVLLTLVALNAQHQWIVLPIGILLGAVRVMAGSTCNCFALHLSCNLVVVLWGIR